MSTVRAGIRGVRILAALIAVGIAVLVTIDSHERTVIAWAPPTLAETTVADLIADNACWTGAAPDPTVIPGHAVVTLPGTFPRLVPSAIGFDIWTGAADGTLHAFCP